MEAADKLCDALFRWLDNRKECAGKLKKLVQELEDVHEGSNIVQAFGAAASVGAISGAVIASVLTGGLAGPLVAVAGASYTTLKVSSTLLEKLISSSTFKQATKLIEKDEKAGTDIQNLLQDLKDRCAETLKVRCRETLKDRCRGALLRTHADELDCEVTTQLMLALARRNNTPVSLDFLRSFNRATFFRHNAHGGLDRDKAFGLIFKALGAVGFFSLVTCSLKVSGKEMMKNIELIGIKAAEAGSTALAVIGVGMCLRDLIVKTKDLIKDNRVTKASKILRDSAREILDGQKKLKEDLDAMQEIIQKLLQMKKIIKKLGGYSLSMDENGQKIIDYIKGTCTDDTVLSWLDKKTNKNHFVNLLRFCLERLTIPEDLTKPGGGHIDIVLVAHGRIVDQFMPSCVLVPTDNIRDTILYSPWNCGINSKAAYAIAQGFIKVTDRELCKKGSWPDWEPDPLPDHWNSMRASRHNIPGILLSPVKPEDDVWKLFHQLWMSRMERKDRVMISYLLPQDKIIPFEEIPLYMFIFAISFILMIHGKTATVHLAACLGRTGSPLRPEEWVRQEWLTQYAYTSDGTVMSVDLSNRNMDSELYRALRSLFDRNRR